MLSACGPAVNPKCVRFAEPAPIVITHAVKTNIVIAVVVLLVSLVVDGVVVLLLV